MMRFPGKPVGALLAAVLMFAVAGSAAAQSPEVCATGNGAHSDNEYSLVKSCHVPDNAESVFVELILTGGGSGFQTSGMLDNKSGQACQMYPLDETQSCYVSARGKLEIAWSVTNAVKYTLIARWVNPTPTVTPAPTITPTPTPSPTITPTTQITTTRIYTLPTTGDHALYSRSLDAGDILISAPLWAALIFWLAIIIRRAAIGRNDE